MTRAISKRGRRRGEGETGEFSPLARRLAPVKASSVAGAPADAAIAGGGPKTQAAPRGAHGHAPGGRSIDLLVTPECTTVFWPNSEELLKIPEVRIHVYRRGFQITTPLFVVENGPVMPPATLGREPLEPRRFDALMFDGVASKPPSRTSRHGASSSQW